MISSKDFKRLGDIYNNLSDKSAEDQYLFWHVFGDEYLADKKLYMDEFAKLMGLECFEFEYAIYRNQARRFLNDFKEFQRKIDEHKMKVIIQRLNMNVMLKDLDKRVATIRLFCKPEDKLKLRLLL